MRLGLGLSLTRLGVGGVGGGGGTPVSTMVAPPTLSGDAIVGGTLWCDDGLDSPTTTYTRQWVSGASDPPATPISGQTGQSLTVPSIGGQYVACLVTPANGEPVRYTDAVRIHYATMTAPVLLRTSASGGSPFTYTVTYDNTVFADDIERVQYSSTINFTAILWDATRGLTEAAFNAPFLPDDTVDADPAWDTAPPTFTGTYYVRRKVISLDGLVESNWSNTESNFSIVSAVNINTAATHAIYTISGDLLSFTSTTGFEQRVGRINGTRTGDRTLELLINALPTNAYIGVGYDDGVKNWTGAVTIDSGAGWNGAAIFASAGGAESYISDGTAVSPNNSNSSVLWQVGDRMRIRITQGTFTGATPNNDAVIRLSRVRAGVETASVTLTGRASTSVINIVFFQRFGAAGTFDFTTLDAPAINVSSQEYQ